MNELKKIKKRIWIGFVVVVSIFGILAILGHFFFKLFLEK
jgi:hypothetical protein